MCREFTEVATLSVMEAGTECPVTTVTPGLMMPEERIWSYRATEDGRQQTTDRRKEIADSRWQIANRRRYTPDSRQEIVDSRQ
jgi:hypothetical protein